MRGPAPTPSHILKLRGSKQLYNRKGEPQPEPAMPMPPDSLTDFEREGWEMLTRMVVALGVATAAEESAFHKFAEAWGEMREAQRHMEADGKVLTGGNGGQYLNPWHGVKNRAIDRWSDIMSKCGCTPSDRTRVRTEAGEGSKSTNDKSKFFTSSG
jgi:P27 family predicted phage terminase small subunit